MVVVRHRCLEMFGLTALAWASLRYVEIVGEQDRTVRGQDPFLAGLVPALMVP
jgi:hypothetical protein